MLRSIHEKDFIAVSDYSPEELQGILDLSVDLKKEHQAGGNEPILKGKVLAMVFQKPVSAPGLALTWPCDIWGRCPLPISG
jgi:ornithine carbamoyltransferase